MEWIEEKNTKKNAGFNPMIVTNDTEMAAGLFEEAE